MFFAYMLDCADGTIYTGHTDDLDVRYAQHVAGYFPKCYTLKRRPLTLLWAESFGTRVEALEAERRIKGWSAAKKRALAAGDWALLSELARCRTDARVTRPSTSSGLADEGQSCSARPELVEARAEREQ